MQRIFPKKHIIHASRGEVLDTSDSVFFIDEGAVGQFAKSDTTKRLLFAYKIGEVFPFTPEQRSKSSGREFVFRAMSDSELRVLSRFEFELLMQDPENAQVMLDCAARIMQSQMERIDNLQEDQTMKRLLERLIYVGLRFGTKDGTAIVIDIPMSHVDLASSINTTRETVNRFMKQLEGIGVISLNKQMIRINSLPEIKDMLEQDSLKVSKQSPADNYTVGKAKLTTLSVAGLLAEMILRTVQEVEVGAIIGHV